MWYVVVAWLSPMAKLVTRTGGWVGGCGWRGVVGGVSKTGEGVRVGIGEREGGREILVRRDC